MTLHGMVVNGVIVPENGGVLPEGAKVTIILDEQIGAEKSLRNLLLEFSGTCPGMPEDMAARHDDYIHGAPKP